MAYTLEDLIARLEGAQSAYTPLTREEMEREAQNRYQAEYDQKRLNAQQTYQTGDAALLRELGGLEAAYDGERQRSAAQYDQTYREADRHALSRGMQRSSYNGATLAGISLAGENAQQEITERQTAHRAELEGKRTLLSEQLAGQLAGYDQGQRTDTLRYLDELEAREYDRLAAHNAEQQRLAVQIYEYRHQLEREAAEQARWQAEFEAKYGGGASGGGGGRRGGRRSGEQKPASLADMAALSATMAALGGVQSVVGARR